ncbi:MAG: alanine racemase [bacterium]
MSKFNRREFLRLAGTAPLGFALWNHGRGPAAFSKAPAKPTDPWLEIDLNNIAWNLSQIRQRVHPRPVMAVIKANAYGHGLVEIAKFLEKQHIRYLAVGKVQEALHVRESGVSSPILNFGPFSPQEAEQLVRLNISQSVYTDQVAALAEAARKLNRTAKVHIKVDSGLGRVGVPYYLALPFIQKVASMPEITIEGIFTTFTEDEAFDNIQLERFLQVCTAASKRGITIGLRHAASSAAVLAFPQAYLDMVRPGITIYGHYPSRKEYRERKLDLRPALALKARVIYVKDLRPGDSVSYHRKFTAQNETQVATLPIGYSDGYPYQVAGKAEAIVRARRWPVIAAVTANHTSLNVTGAGELKIGEEAVLMGRQGDREVTAEEVADWAGTSVYKILIGMNPLLPRIYI